MFYHDIDEDQLFNNRINNQGATWGLSIGFILGMLKLVIQAFFGAEKISNPSILSMIGDFNFLYFSGVLFLISVVIIILVSYKTSPPDQQKIHGLTFSTIDHEVIRSSWNTKDVVATIIILGLVATLYIYFSFWISFGKSTNTGPGLPDLAT